MSRKGKCWDNASMESFFGTIKREMIHYLKYRPLQEAMAEISEYIEVFYNRQRRHSSQGNLSGGILELIHHAARGCLTII